MDPLTLRFSVFTAISNLIKKNTMVKNAKSPETFEEFRKSFFYGSRSDMSFKFLDHLSDEQGTDFLQKLFRNVITSIDTGDSDTGLTRMPYVRGTYSQRI